MNDDDDGPLTDADLAALRQFVSSAEERGGGGRGGVPLRPVRIVLNVRGREIGINGNADIDDFRGDLNNFVRLLDGNFRSRLVRDLLTYLDPPHSSLLDTAGPSPFSMLPITWNVALRRQNVTEEDFDALLDVARSSGRTHVVLGLRSVAVGDKGAAQRAVRLLAAFANLKCLNFIDAIGEEDLYNLESARRDLLTIGNLPRSTLSKGLHMLLKAFLAHKVKSPTLANKLTSFRYRCRCSVRPILLLEFFESIAANLEELCFDRVEWDDEECARSCKMIWGRLPSLASLTLFPHLELHLPFVVEGLVAAPRLEKLVLVLRRATRDCSMDEIDERMAHYLPSVARLVARSRTLRDLKLWSFRIAGHEGTRYDATPVLLRAAESSSLEQLELYYFSVGGPAAMIRRDGPWINETVSSVVFYGCELRAGTFEILSALKGITSIRLVAGCKGLELAGQWQSFFASRPNLPSFEVVTDEDENAKVTVESIMSSIVEAGLSFDPLRLCWANDGPTLKKLLLETGGTVDLSLLQIMSKSSLVAGIEGAKKLECLRLYLCNTSPTGLAQVFKAVQVNKSLRSFACTYSLVFGRTEHGSARERAARSLDARLLDLMRLNSRLKSLAFTGDGPSRALLPTIVKGLRENRSIEVLEVNTWSRPLFADSTLIDDFAATLEVHNTTLKMIKGLEHETNDVRERFERYLWQNRSGRHFLRNADLVTPSLLPCILVAISKDTGADGIRYFLKNLSKERLLRILSSRRKPRSRPSVEDPSCSDLQHAFDRAAGSPSCPRDKAWSEVSQAPRESGGGDVFLMSPVAAGKDAIGDAIGGALAPLSSVAPTGTAPFVTVQLAPGSSGSSLMSSATPLMERGARTFLAPIVNAAAAASRGASPTSNVLSPVDLERDNRSFTKPSAIADRRSKEAEKTVHDRLQEAIDRAENAEARAKAAESRDNVADAEIVSLREELWSKDQQIRTLTESNEDLQRTVDNQAQQHAAVRAQEARRAAEASQQIERLTAERDAAIAASAARKVVLQTLAGFVASECPSIRSGDEILQRLEALALDRLSNNVDGDGGPRGGGGGDGDAGAIA